MVIQLKWRHQFQFAGFYMAQEKGYFADEGLSVELRPRQPEQDVITEVLEQRAQYGISDAMLLLHHAQGAPVVLVAAIMQHSPNTIVTLGESGVAQPRDLKNQRLSFYDNGAEGLDILAMLADHDVLSQGFARVDWQQRIPMLLNGSIDAITAYTYSDTFELREAGININIIHPRHYGLDFYGDILFTSREEAREHPERVAALRRAVLRGWEYALNNKSETVDFVFEHYNDRQQPRSVLMNEANAMEALMDRFNTPMGSFDQGRIDFLMDRVEELGLMEQGGLGVGSLLFSRHTSSLTLSDEERAFLASLGPIRAGIESSGWPPFEILSSDGRFSGITADYLSFLQDKLSISFQHERTKSWQEMLMAARAREVDLMPAAVATPDRREYLLFTSPYVRSPMVIVTRDTSDYIADLDQLQSARIGVVADYASDEMLSRYYPSLNLLRYRSTQEGLRDLASGDIDAFVDNLAAASHMIKGAGLANLKISGQTPFNYDLSMGVRQDWPLLHSAIEKALKSMTPQEHDAIYDRWISLTVSQPFPWAEVLPAAVAGTVLFLLLAAYTLRVRQLNRHIRLSNIDLADAQEALRQKNEELELLSITDKLTGTFNRHHLDNVLADEFERARRYHQPLALVMFDLDRFKQVNDHHGHQAGDRALQEFTRLVQQAIRRNDIFGRWGGEEFLLICPQTNSEGAHDVAEKIRQAVQDHSFSHGERLTVSAGVSDTDKGHTIDALILAADKELYAAKQSGRNRVLVAGASAS